MHTWRILAPVDLSGNADKAIVHAIDAASAMGADLTLLCVLEQRWYRRRKMLCWPRSAMGGPETRCDIHRVVLPGSVPETVQRYAKFIHADLVLMTRGKCNWLGSWTRSMTAAVLASVEKPVWAANARYLGDNQFRCGRIVCVVSLDGTDATLLHQAGAMAERCGADLVLLHVIPAGREFFEPAPGPLLRTAAHYRIRELASELRVPHRISVMIGRADQCAALAVREHSADLVMMRRGGLDAQAMMARLNCPLLAVPDVTDEGAERKPRELTSVSVDRSGS